MSDSSWPRPPREVQTVVVTGGLGFIGSNFLNRLVPMFPEVRFVNLDAMTYAGNPENVAGIAECENYVFQRLDIAEAEAVDSALDSHRPDWLFHFAAETHVDRSVLSPERFVRANVLGTINLLETCRRLWAGESGHLFHHVSTDEVYGSLGASGKFTEATAYDPSSPYSASKASSDHFVRAYHRTFGLPARITNCSNNYGPRQFPEKLIPLMTLNAFAGEPLPVYGSGTNVRDWLFVDDHCEAIWTVACAGQDGETYNIGGSCELSNLEVVDAICLAVAAETGRPVDSLRRLVRHVTDRPGHDFRYAIDTTKIERELGWHPRATFSEGLRNTVAWYISNPEWVAHVRSGEYHQWIEHNYGART